MAKKQFLPRFKLPVHFTCSLDWAMHPYRIPIWKAAPFCRLLLPLIAGVVLQWYIQFTAGFIICCLTCLASAFILLNHIALELRYVMQAAQGLLLHIIIASFAMLLTWHNDIRHDTKWFGNYYNDSVSLLVCISEPLTEKSKSFKCEGNVEAVYLKGNCNSTKGKLLIYLSKDPFTASLQYGSRVLIKKPLQSIKNSGNPGAFDYERYAAFQQLFHNVYLKENDLVLLQQKHINLLDRFIFSARKHIVDVFKKYMPADKNILGIAEALLIGYKEDLDKELVQSYSNTGVVHIIAISGLHLGLIYVMLVWIFNRLPFIKRSRILKVSLILSSLWLFSLLTGASASVLRSAVMFTCIIIGQHFFTRSSVYNSLAASAFILLCYDPYFLWDVGFQLSYFAVIGIIWLQPVLYRTIYVKNKLLDKLWSMASVTIAAQVITFPVCIYYFHQFPNLFLLTNLVAVPLSTVILFAEIFLMAFSWVSIIGIYTGKLISLLISLMNLIIQTCDHLPFSRVDNINATVLTTWLLYVFVIATCCWMIYKNKKIFRVAMISLFAFTMLRVYAKISSYQQKKLIIYNVPQHAAIDFIAGNKYVFAGDSALQQEGLLQNFHLKPARISMQLYKNETVLPNLSRQKGYWQFYTKKIFIIDSAISYEPQVKKLPVDILVISKDPFLKIGAITAAIKPSVIVFDSSNSLWKIAKWKKECEGLALPCFSIPEQGAFVLDIKE